ncbi:MAG: inositol-phosphate phosphatase [Xanthomonadales bacterium]|nr:inositol-phosphate phosphatase [Xanthomonadales bacterium]
MASSNCTRRAIGPRSSCAPAIPPIRWRRPCRTWASRCRGAGRCSSSRASCDGTSKASRQVAEGRVPAQALAVAKAAARAAAAEIVPLFRSAGLAVETKDDDSPVTEADRRAERAIRVCLASAFPDIPVFGEEFGGRASATGWLWLVDPLDGTKSFVRGNPVFSTQIALWHDGLPMLSVSGVPATGELAWAVRGEGAHRGRLSGGDATSEITPLHCRDSVSLDQAAVSTGNLRRLAAGPAWADLGRLVGKVWRWRGYGDYLHYHLLAGGGIDAVIESDVHVLDIAGLCLLVSEAGGVFTDLDGAPVGPATDSVLAAATPALHAQLLGALSGWRG